jgi:hypothetical protein
MPPTHRLLAVLALTASVAFAAPSTPASTSPAPAPLPAPALAPGEYAIFPDRPKQTIWGLGFEIQSDSIGSGNHGLPEEPIAVPHDLVPAERERLAKEMLAGFRYCRLAGGLYWRGLDAEKKFHQPRWPEQLQELKQLLDTAGVEGLSFEYWSPAPFWKSNRAYPGGTLRCFGKDFATDPDYHGDVDRFLKDFAQAVVADIATLKQAGLKVSMWGLQNEPHVGHSLYSTCKYESASAYVKTYTAVAGAIRAADPSILLFSDTENGFPKKIATAMHDPAVAALVDAYVVHTIGHHSSNVPKIHAAITAKLPPRPWFQNEYEYLQGGATPDRCLNTVEHIMNSFQLAENPTWFWLHALKPLKNAEASGYALGFWKSLIDKPKTAASEKLRRWPEGPEITGLPAALQTAELITVPRPTGKKTAISYNFSVNQPVTVYLLAEAVPGLTLPPEWQKTEFTATWEGGTDTIYQRAFPKGKIEIPAATGKTATGRPSLAHALLVAPSDSATFDAEIGENLPIIIRSDALALERKAAAIAPGHWIFNPYNWNAVGSFTKRMPWNSVALSIAEGKFDAKARIFAFKRPNGKMTIVVANRSTSDARPFAIATGLPADTTWQGFRYTPEEAGPDTRGVPIGKATGAQLNPKLPTQSWEFWDQQ